MRRSLLATATLTIMTFSAACALAFTPPSTSLEKAISGTYEMDAGHTSVLFELSHLGYSNYFGRFNTIAGTLDFDAKAPEKSKLNITIDIGSIDTNHTELEGKLKGKEWFDAAQFPKATFTSTKVEKLTATTGKVTGDLTLHGVTKPVVLDVTFNGAGENPFAKVPQLGFSAKGAIKRSDFGISQYVPMVGDEVALTIETEFQLKK